MFSEPNTILTETKTFSLFKKLPTKYAVTVAILYCIFPFFFIISSPTFVTVLIAFYYLIPNNMFLFIYNTLLSPFYLLEQGFIIYANLFLTHQQHMLLLDYS